MAIAVQTVELRLFGEPGLFVDGRAVSFAGFPRLPAILAFLALHPAAVRRDQAAFALWPDETESAARANLRRAVHRLQSLLPAGTALEVTSTTLSLRRGGVSCDVWELERLLGEPAITAESAARALQIYRGGLMTRVEDEWLAPFRDRVRERFAAVLAAAMETALLENDAAAADYARGLLAVDPFREDALRALMNAQVNYGDRAGALSSYRAFAEKLRAEFAVEPDAETARLYENLSSAPPVRRTHNLPYESDPFIGRETEIARLATLYASRRTITICGAPGVGKTRLALHYAHGTRGDRNETWYVQLAGARSSAEMFDAFLSALRVRRQPQEAAAEALCRTIADGAVLLLVDNAEHLVEDAGNAIEELLARCPNLSVLVTSREPLKIGGKLSCASSRCRFPTRGVCSRIASPPPEGLTPPRTSGRSTSFALRSREFHWLSSSPRRAARFYRFTRSRRHYTAIRHRRAERNARDRPIIKRCTTRSRGVIYFSRRSKAAVCEC